MLKLGITGGIASGKTTATDYIEKKYGAYVFNADKESKKHLKSSIILQKKINFDILADKVFSNSINHKIMNGIMWPEIYILIENSFANIKRKRKHNLFIVDAALIFEAQFTHFFDKTLLITANEKIRIKRATQRRNISLENIQNRISKQMIDSEKKKLANYTITNNKDLKNFKKKLDFFYNQNLF